MNKTDTHADQFVRSLYFALFVVQIIFITLWACRVITWHWALVFSPLWVLLSLPIFASFLLLFIETVEGRK